MYFGRWMDEWVNEWMIYVCMQVLVCKEDFGHEFLEFWVTGCHTLPADSSPCPCFYFSPQFRKWPSQRHSPPPHPRTAQTALRGKEGCHSPVPFSSPAEVLGQPSRGRCCAASPEHRNQRGSNREVLGVVLSPQNLSRASAQHWCCLCIFLLPPKQLVPTGL